MKTRPARLPALALLLGVSGLSGCSWFRHDDGPAKIAATDFYSPTSQPAPTMDLVPQLLERAAPTMTARDDPATRSTTRSAVPVGTYMTIGGILAEVNGVPIYANRVMRLSEAQLRARARQLSAAAFQYEADRIIERELNGLVLDEINYAAAQHNLTPEDKKLADYLTTDYRQKLILDAGGSLQQARKAAADQGEDFEEMVRHQNRRFLIRLFIERKISPRVQITTADMRRYYRDNVDKLFTVRSSADVLIIRIDPARSGGKAAALDKIRSLRERVTSGKEDFATVAGTTNDDGSLLRSKGRMTLVPGTLNAEKFEAAIFKSQVGEVIEVVEDIGGFYIAKIVTLTKGKVVPFEDVGVQQRIIEAIRNTQVQNLLDQFDAEQRQNSVVRTDPSMKDTALEMISQYYPVWHAE